MNSIPENYDAISLPEGKNIGELVTHIKNNLDGYFLKLEDLLKFVEKNEKWLIANDFACMFLYTTEKNEIKIYFVFPAQKGEKLEKTTFVENSQINYGPLPIKLIVNKPSDPLEIKHRKVAL
jgi:hypothetical protein